MKSKGKPILLGVYLIQEKENSPWQVIDSGASRTSDHFPQVQPIKWWRASSLVSYRSLDFVLDMQQSRHRGQQWQGLQPKTQRSAPFVAQSGSKRIYWADIIEPDLSQTIRLMIREDGTDRTAGKLVYLFLKCFKWVLNA